ncbi:hypothetical protein [Mobiluncus mulieris]
MRLCISSFLYDPLTFSARALS